MWSTSQSDRLFDTFLEHPRVTTVIATFTPGGPRLLDDEASTTAAAIRDHARAANIPVVVRMRAVEQQPGYSHVIVYHVPDVAGTRMPC